MNYSFVTSKEAADLVGITPTDIGVPANQWPRKKELIATGKFDAASLSGYQDKEFVLLKDLAKGAVAISVALNSDVTSRGTVQINNGTAGATATAELNIGDSVTVKCNMSLAGDVFDGWYKGSIKVSGDVNYTFTVTGEESLVAKILFIDVVPTSLSYDAEGGSKTVTVTSNVSNWTVS